MKGNTHVRYIVVFLAASAVLAGLRAVAPSLGVFTIQTHAGTIPGEWIVFGSIVAVFLKVV